VSCVKGQDSSEPEPSDWERYTAEEYELSVCLSVCLCLCMCGSVDVSLCLSVCLSECVCMCLSLSVKDQDSTEPEPSDWERYAAEEYELLVAEEGATDAQHDDASVQVLF